MYTSGVAASQRMRAILLKSQVVTNARPQQLQHHEQPQQRLCVGDAPMPRVHSGQVLVKVGAAGVNRMDLLQRAGKYPPPAGASEILGPEAAGIVVSDGKFPEGTPVACLLPGGGYAEYAAVHPGLCIPIPENLTVKEGACIPENWLTAYQLLQEVAGCTDFPSNGGKPSSMRHALVYAAASGVGVALLQILREFIPSIKVLAVSGSAEKLDRCRRLGAAISLNYNDFQGDMGEEIIKQTGGEGVDIVFDCIGASFFEQTVKSLKIDSTWVLYGSLGGHKVSISLAGLMQKRARLLASTLRNRSEEYQLQLVHNFCKDILPKFRDGSLKVILDSEFPAESAEDAHERLLKRLNFGKVIIVMNPEIANMNGNP